MPAEKADARSGSAPQRPRWPMIVCRTPKGWTGPKVVDGKPVEGTWRPVIFALHGYPGIIHKLTGRRRNHDNIHVRGYKVAGTATTPFDMVVLNNLARFLLALDAITRIPRLSGQVEHARQRYRSRRMTDRDPVESRPHGLRPGSDLSAG